MPSVALVKAELRRRMRAKRASMAEELWEFREQIARFVHELHLASDAVIGGYRALAGEADPVDLLHQLAIPPRNIAYPRVVAIDKPLEFRSYVLGRKFLVGRYGVEEPPLDWPFAIPTVVFVPLLAFDKCGYRLGYGGGYYDRTLADLRGKGETLAIGVAFAGQEVDSIPHDANDQRLDMVVTENGVKRFD